MTVPPIRLGRLVVLNDFGTAQGGATSLALACALGARRANVPVTYITGEGPIDPSLAESGVEVLKIPGTAISVSDRVSGAVQGVWRTNTSRALARYIAERDTPSTVYHLHNWGHFLSPSVFSALRGVQRRMVMTTHDFFLVCPNGAQFNFQTSESCALVGGHADCVGTKCDRRNGLDKLWRLARHAARSKALSLRDFQGRVLLIHPALAPSMINASLDPARLTVIRNPLRPFIDGRIEAERNREVLFVGRLTYEKGPDLAARAAQEAGALMRFVGEGPMADQLAAQFPGAIFEGFLPRERIATAAARARMLVMPSRWAEPYGMVAGEALWSGLPVIASQSAFLAPEIAAANAGLAVDTRDPARFREAILTLLSDDQLTLTMSQNAREATKNLGLSLTDWETANLSVYADLLNT